MTDRGPGRDRTVLGLAILSVLLLAGIEFGLYRPQRARLAAAERDLAALQAQVTALDRRHATDQQVLASAGTELDGAGIRRRYGEEGGLVHLNRLIERSRLSRVELRTETPLSDGPFNVERFYFTLQGPAGRVLDFLRTMEQDERMTRVDQLRIEPLPESAELLFKARVSIYSLPAGGTQP